MLAADPPPKPAPTASRLPIQALPKVMCCLGVHEHSLEEVRCRREIRGEHAEFAQPENTC